MNDLKHVGVLGMRWGHRKTPKTVSKDHAIASKIKSKKLSQMSNDEIRTLSNRIRLEQEYKNLNPSKIKRGKIALTNTMTTLGQISTGIATITTLVIAGKKVYSFALEKVGK